MPERESFFSSFINFAFKQAILHQKVLVLTAFLVLQSVIADAQFYLEDSTDLNYSDDCRKPVPLVTDAMTLRLRMIAGAKEEVLISYFSTTEEPNPAQILGVLKEVAEKGVRVKFMVDHMNNKLSPNMMKYLGQLGVEIRFFNEPVLRNIFRIDRRMHDKLLIIDRQYLLVGGRNLDQKYFEPDLNVSGTFYDYDEMYAGEVARNAAEYFLARWTSSWTTRANQKRIVRLTQSEAQVEEFILLEAQAQAAYNLRLSQNRDKSLETMISGSCSSVEFVSNRPKRRRRCRDVEKAFISEIDKARHTVDLQNAYILFTRPFKISIRNALDRGVKVRVLSNSLQSFDIPVFYGSYLNLRPKLLRWGVEIHEFKKAQTMHSKTAIIDSFTTLVGSFNLDPRSAKRNSETMVIARDSAAALSLTQYFENTQANSWKILPDGMPEGETERHPDTKFGKRLKVTLWRFTIGPLVRDFM